MRHAGSCYGLGKVKQGEGTKELVTRFSKTFRPYEVVAVLYRRNDDKIVKEQKDVPRQAMRTSAVISIAVSLSSRLGLHVIGRGVFLINTELIAHKKDNKLEKRTMSF